MANSTKLLCDELKYELKNIFKNNSMRDIVDAKFQSWNSYTNQLLTANRKEFDNVYFCFTNTQLENNKYIIYDDWNLESVYFGRPIKNTYYIFKYIDDPIKIYDKINSCLNDLHNGEPSKKSIPILTLKNIVSNITIDYGYDKNILKIDDLNTISIICSYIWEF